MSIKVLEIIEFSELKCKNRSNIDALEQKSIEEIVVSIRCRAQLKPDGTRWRTVGEVKGKHASGVGSQ